MAELKRELEKGWKPNKHSMDLCDEYKFSQDMIDIELVLFRAWHLTKGVKRTERGYNQCFQNWMKGNVEKIKEKQKKDKTSEKRGGPSYKTYAPAAPVVKNKSVGREALNKLLGKTND